VTEVSSIDNGQNVYIGRTPDGGSPLWFKGNIFNVDMYNRALTDSELLTDGKAMGKNIFFNGLICRYNLDEKANGATSNGEVAVIDHGPYKNNGTTANIAYNYSPISFRKRR
jgi:hypothetical protein